MEWRGFHYGDVVQTPAGFAGTGTPPRGVILLVDGSALFVEYVADASLEDFLDRAVAPDARLLPLRRDARGKRERTLASALEHSREETVEGFPNPRTTGWCLQHLVAEGRGLEAHFEHFKTLCGLQPNQWGMEEYGNLILVAKALLLVDQLDGPNIHGVELIFRRLQTIEYSYSDRLRERSAQSTAGKLTVDEQAAFGAMARVETKLMICPALLDAARQETEKEAGLAKSLLKAREARAALAKK